MYLNGGIVLDADGSVIQEEFLPEATVAAVVAFTSAAGLSLPGGPTSTRPGGVDEVQ